MNGWFATLTRTTPAPKGTVARQPHFGWIALTCLGIGAIIGAGIFSMPGHIASLAGPAGILSFAIAGAIMLGVSRCYQAFSGRLPNGVSAYSYVYHSLGELAAVIVGFGLFVEYFFGTAAVSQAWAEYLFVSTGLKLPLFWQGPGFNADGTFRFGINIVSAGAVLMITGILWFGGIKKSAWLNAVLVGLKLALLVLFVVVGFKHFDAAHLFPFFPFGIKGMLAGAALAVFPFLGFDQLYCFALEAKSEKQLNLATYLSVALSGALYITVMLVMIGAVPAVVQNAAGAHVANSLYAGSEAAAPLATVLSAVGEGWVATFIAVAAVIGLFNVLLVGCMAAPRVFKNMAEDGLLPQVFARTHNGSPVVGTLITGSICAVLTALVPFDKLAHMMVLGTLVAFAAVGIGAKKEKLVGWGVALFTVVGCVVLICQLDTLVFYVYPVTLAAAVSVYLLYGYKHSRLNKPDAPTETKNDVDKT